jgi:hypothetical protein
MSKGLGYLQTFKAPAPKLPFTEALRPAAALGVVVVMMPRIDGIKSASEAPVGYSYLDHE